MLRKQPSDASNWQAEIFRITVFLAQSVDVDAEGWWTKLTGAKSETKNARPGAGVLVEAGPVGGNLLTLSVQPGRIDWVLGPGPLPENQSDVEIQLRTVGDFLGTEPIFSQLIRAWLADCPPTSRLGYGAVLLQPTGNRESGYSRVAEYLPNVTINPVDSEDFFYQINRPRASEFVRGLRLNRLSKWSVAAFQAVNFSMSLVQGSASQPLVHAHSAKPTMACRLELDISTSADVRQPLAHDRLPGVFDELMQMGHEIAERGDVP